VTLPRRFQTDANGAAAIEFGMTAPIFFVLLLGVIFFGLLLWTQTGLQHGAEMAARCASINKDICGTPAATQQFAATQSFGINPSPAIFAVSNQECGVLVEATYNFKVLTQYFGVPSIALRAHSCFPS
jgi:Flp pilus assembly protein TadG